jgi:flagellar biosynthesis chaperone FliJ
MIKWNDDAVLTARYKHNGRIKPMAQELGVSYSALRLYLPKLDERLASNENACTSLQLAKEWRSIYIQTMLAKESYILRKQQQAWRSQLAALEAKIKAANETITAFDKVVEICRRDKFHTKAEGRHT